MGDKREGALVPTCSKAPQRNLPLPYPPLTFASLSSASAPFSSRMGRSSTVRAAMLRMAMQPERCSCACAGRDDMTSRTASMAPAWERRESEGVGRRLRGALQLGVHRSYNKV